MNDSDSDAIELDLLLMHRMLWVCRHPFTQHKFAVRLEANGVQLWLVDVGNHETEWCDVYDPEFEEESFTPVEFKSWVVAFRHLIETGEEHISLCLHGDHYVPAGTQVH